MNNRDEFKQVKKNRSYPSYAIVSIISAVVGGLIFSLIFATTIEAPKEGSSGNQSITINPSDDITTVEAVAEKAMSSVVGITTTQIARDFWSTRAVQGVGSGVIVSEDGYILTNSHVVSDGDVEEIKVMFLDGTERAGRLIWNDSAIDLAVVKVEAEGLNVAELGNSDTINIGQQAIAIGNPLGLEFERTVTAGIVSGVDRSLQISENSQLEGLIQTDASINVGNSGGPLLDSEGKVIGINTLKISAGEGLGFALPINMAKPIVEEIIRTGEFREVYIGIEGMDAVRYQKMTGIDLGVQSGVLVAKIAENSPADRAGLQVEDIIVSIDGDGVDSFQSLRKRLYKYKPGDEVRVGIVREGRTEDAVVKLEEVQR